MGGRVEAKGGEGRRVVGSRGGASRGNRCGEERQSRAESGHTLDARAIDRLTQACGLRSGLVSLTRPTEQHHSSQGADGCYRG